MQIGRKKCDLGLCGNREYDLKMLVEDMIISDVKLMKKDAYLKAGGYETLNYFE